MLRREFLTLLGEVAVLPYEARVQQSAVIGCLHPIFPDANADHIRAFRQGLKDRGYVESENVTIALGWVSAEARMRSRVE
jgi:hypothetical protein